VQARDMQLLITPDHVRCGAALSTLLLLHLRKL
jgi:hypothetical protein